MKISSIKIAPQFGLVLCILISCCLSACDTEPKKETKLQPIDYPSLYRASVEALTEAIVHDIFSPPVASRIYAYPGIAAYEIMAADAKDKKNSLTGKLTDLQAIPNVPTQQNYNPELASLKAFLTVGKTLVFSPEPLDRKEQEIIKLFKAQGIPAATITQSLTYGDQVAQHIITWANQDNYAQTRTYSKHQFERKAGRWMPTPPDFLDAIEPHWNKIRPFVLDSASQFAPEAPTNYSVDKDSKFYKEMSELYSYTQKLTDEEIEVAKFWDCNPFVTKHVGHYMEGVKKLTPGGHWIGLSLMATEKKQMNLYQTIKTYTFTAISIADAFISCWDEKYRSNLIRPETVINIHLDPDWKPALITPSFPEYPSGHSVASASAAAMLTAIVGEDFAFRDSTEVAFGLPVRSFSSFTAAAEEAAISRFYGGIHYKPAIYNGLDQGKQVGNFIVKKLVR